MPSRIGFDHYTIGHRDLSPEATLDFARSHGLDGVQFLEPGGDRPGARPRAAGGLPRSGRGAGALPGGRASFAQPGAARRGPRGGTSRPPSTRASWRGTSRRSPPGVPARPRLRRRPPRPLPTRHPLARPDRRDARRAASDSTPVLRAVDLRIALETHADLTVDELLALLDRLDPDVAGVTLDTGNLVMRLDDPVRAVERLAPRVLCTHVKDCVLAFTPARAPLAGATGRLGGPADARPARPAAPGQPSSEPLDRAPPTDLRPADPRPDLARLLPGLEARFARRRRSPGRAHASRGSRPVSSTPEDRVEAIPWPERDLDWLACSLGYLRRVVPALIRVDPPHVEGTIPA